MNEKTNKHTNERMDRRTNGQTNGTMEQPKNINIMHSPTQWIGKGIKTHHWKRKWALLKWVKWALLNYTKNSRRVLRGLHTAMSESVRPLTTQPELIWIGDIRWQCTTTAEELMWTLSPTTLLTRTASSATLAFDCSKHKAQHDCCRIFLWVMWQWTCPCGPVVNTLGCHVQ